MLHPHNGKVFGHKMNEILLYSVTWMKLENIILSGEKTDIKDDIWYDSIYMKC